MLRTTILLLFFGVFLLARSAGVYAQTCSGNAIAVTSQTGVTNPTNATGAANSSNASMYDNADVIVLDLGVYLEVGATYTIRWKKNSTSGNDPSMLVAESYDATSFTNNGAATTVSSTSYVNTNKTVGIPLMRYVRITSQNDGNLDLDAITFTNVACSNCSVTVTSAVPAVCSDTKYDLAVTVTYSDPPTGNIVLAIGDGVGTLFTFTPDGTSPDTYTIPDLTASNVQDINVKAYFANHPACTHTLTNAYDAPATCGTYCSGNLLANPSFEITSTNVTPPPVNTFYTPASWVAPALGYADHDWLRPDGIGHIGLYGTGTSVAYQNVPVTVGNAYTLTLYSAMHFPLTNVGSAKIQYYTAANVAIGVGNVHYVTHDWEDDHGFGGPYTLFLGAAPANASYVRVTLENHNPTAVGESVKFDALCLTASSCTATGCDVVVSPIRIVGRQNNTSADAEGRVFQRYDIYDLPCWQSGGGGTITNTNTGAPNGTSNQEVYQYGIYQDLLDWHFAVPDGSYTVLIHYSENSMTAANQRKFDVIIEDVQVENDFDIFAQTGAQRKALVKSYTTTVADNNLNLRFEKVVDRPIVQGIEIIPNFCTATQSVSISNVNVSGCYRNGSGQSKSTVSVEVAWDNALARDSIRVTLGAQSKWIYPGQYNTGGLAGTIMSPQVVAFEVDANGAAGTVTATMFNNNDCSDTENFTAPAACPATTCTAGQLGGTVFNDNDADGVKDAGETYGTSGVTVTVYDCNGNTATATTDADGKWAVSTALTYPVRVEYSNLPAYLGANGTPNGTDGRTTVQFVSAADCSVDLGVLNASDYCQATPDIFLPCFVNGDPLPGGSSAGTYDAFIRLTYGATGLSPTITHVASASEVGTLWGVAYDKKRNKVYTSAVLRRHAGLGPLGLGGIYQVNPTTNATSSFVDVQGTLGINVGGISGGPFAGVTNSSRGLSTNPLTPTHDSLAFAQIGKIGIGDLDISENGDYLYFVNLYDKKLYKLDITGASPTVSASYTIPSACSNGSSRPFALKVKNGVVYVGVVCDGSTAENRSDLRAYVYGLSESSGTFSTVFNFPLTYPKGYPLEGLYHMGNWRTWTDDFDKIDMQYVFGSSLCAYPQPILSDIETDIDGSLILGFADRSAFQLGWVNYSPKSSDLSTYNVYSGGDILRAAYKNGAYFLENNAYLAGITGAGPNNNQGPGFGEFYSDNYYDAGTLIHSEIAFGALALKPGSGQTVFTVQDPIDNNGNSAGFRYISNTTGLSPSGTSAGARVYVSSGIGTTFGKAVGLGDMELNCGNVTYLEIGNRVWVDTDHDGVQDACESGLSGVKVRLYKGTTLIAETTTNANGEYYFSSASKIGTGTWSGTGADTTLLASTAYTIVFGKAATDQWSNTSNNLTVSGTAYTLTTANSTSDNGNDLNDSDALEASVTGIGIYPMISITTGTVGSVNHTYDVGLTSCALVSACDVSVPPIRVSMYGTPQNTADAEGRVFNAGYVRLGLAPINSHAVNSNTITNTNSGAPNGTSFAALYQRMILDNYLDWHFAVPDGSYTVLLHYVEPNNNAANARLFDVYIEDIKVEDNFDIWVQAGNAQNRALVKSYTTTVNDNDLALRFEQEIGNVLICGVEILPNFCTATQSVSITNVDVSGCYLNASGQSKSTVSVEVAWDNALSRDSIDVTLGGQTRHILPGNYNTTGGYGTIVSPQVVAFEIDANGAAGTVTAVFQNNNDCPDSENFTAPTACPATVCASGNLGGTVFNDYDADGTKDAGETFGTASTTVKVYDCNGNVSTTTTDANGVWSISSALTYPVRVEFTNLPAYVGANGTPNGTNGHTTTQFVNAATCAVDLGVLNPNDYCQSNPSIFLPCYVNGDPLPGGSAAGAMDAFVRLPYGTSGTSPTIAHVANAAEVGTLWGVAYDKKRNKVYSSAFLRRHAGLGPQGLGGIYQTNATTNATSNFVDVQGTLGINVGGLAGGPFAGITNTTRGLSTSPTTPTNDPSVFSLIGKVGIGDLEISEDNDYLYFVNLNDKKLYKLNITGATPTLSASYTIPSGCTNGNSRPFGLKVKNGVVYVGVVCDGATSQSASDIRAFVYSLNETTGTFSTVFDFPLDYPKGYPLVSLPHVANWNAWTDDFEKINTQTTLTGDFIRLIYPQPILADIELDLNGDMILGFSDRTGAQSGWYNYGTTGTTIYGGFSGGDILRAALKNGAYVLENNAYVAGTTGASPNNKQGPGLGEFYNDNFYATLGSGGNANHSEIAIGALTLLPGSGQTIYTTMDPVDGSANAGGFRYISNTTGLSPSGTAMGAQVYSTGNAIGATFGKSIGLGDLELNCGSVNYLQIGNYVWIDTDKDGVQDACEAPLPGVTVRLYKMDGGTTTLVATTTTDSDGEYYFSDLDGTQDTLETGKMYFVVLGEGGQFNTSTNILTISGFNYQLTSQNTGAGANPDLNDSDAYLYTAAGKPFTGYPVDTITIGEAGTVDHTLDFGLKCVEPDLSVSPDTVTVCAPVSVNLATAFTLTDANNTTAASGYPKYYASQSDATNDINDIGSTVTSAGTYWIRKNTTAGCWDTVRVTVVAINPPNAGLDGSATICDNSTAEIDLFSLISGEQAGGTWSRATGTGGTFNMGAGTFTPASGVTTSTFTYTVVGTAPCPNDEAVATININPTPDLIARDTSICTGQSVNLATLFSQDGNAGSITFYQNFADAQAEANAIASTVSPSSTTEFFIRKETAAGCFEIDSVDVLIFSIQTVSLFPTDSTICPGGSFVITATPSGGLGTCSFQWQYLDGATWTDLAGETASTLNTGALTQTRLYRVRYTCPSCQPEPVYSPPTTVTVVSDPTAGLVGNVVTVCSGGGATLQANVSGGSGTPSYQWQSSTDGTIFTNILGETNTQLTVSGLTDTMFYRMQVNFTGAGCDVATSGVGTINIVPDPTIDISGADSVCVGQTVTLTAATSGGTGTCTIQWQERIGLIWSNIAGATNPTYTTPPLSANKDIRARLICTGGGCDVAISDTAHLVAYPYPDAGSDVLLTCPSGGGAADSTYDFNQTGTWQILQQPAGAMASVNSNGQVAGMTEVGEYEFELSVNGCSDTVKITLPNCCPVPECIPVKIVKY